LLQSDDSKIDSTQLNSITTQLDQASIRGTLNRSIKNIIKQRTKRTHDCLPSSDHRCDDPTSGAGFNPAIHYESIFTQAQNPELKIVLQRRRIEIRIFCCNKQRKKKTIYNRVQVKPSNTKRVSSIFCWTQTDFSFLLKPIPNRHWTM